MTSSLDKQTYKEGLFALEATVEGAATSASTLEYTLEDPSGKTILKKKSR